jgi:hypothetical protein
MICFDYVALSAAWFDDAGPLVGLVAPRSCALTVGCTTTERTRLDRSARMFHICSHGSRDARRGAEPGLEGAHALRQRLSREHQVYAALRLSQAA